MITKNTFIAIRLLVVFSLTFLLGEQNLSAQNNVGIGTLTPDPSALLDLADDNKGILIPRIADTNNVSLPATGLLVYLIPANNFFYFNGIYWKAITYFVR